MAENIEKNQNNRSKKAMRILLVCVVFFGLLTIFDKSGWFLSLSAVLVALIYAFGRNQLWYLVVLSVPGLLMGEILFIPITSTWIYEARLAELFLGLAALVYALDLFINSNFKKAKIDKLAFWLFLFLLLSVFSIFWAHDYRLFVFALKTPVFSWLAYALAINLLDDKRKQKIFLYCISLTVIALSVQIFWKFHSMGFSSDFFFDRSSILLPFAPLATTAALLAFLAPLALGLYFHFDKRNKWKIVSLIGFFSAFLAVFLTLGKSAITSLLFGLFLIFCAQKKRRVAIILFLFWFLTIAYFGFQPYFNGLFERLKMTFLDVNTEFRIKEYRLSYELIAAHPLIGVGAGQQIRYYQRMLDQEQGNFVNNFFLQSLIDLGVLGLALTLLITKNIFGKTRAAWLAGGKEKILLAGFIASFSVAFLNGLVEVTFYALPYAIVFWICAGAFVKISSAPDS